MATALSPRRITHSLASAAPPEPSPAVATLAGDLWVASLDLAQAALASGYIQGIKHGPLNPNYYGQYSVQDVSYCHHGLEDWKTCAARAKNPDVKAFAEARVKSWTAYAQETYGDWHITDPTAVKLCDAAQSYMDFESRVARTYDPIYAPVVMTPATASGPGSRHSWPPRPSIRTCTSSGSMKIRAVQASTTWRSSSMPTRICSMRRRRWPSTEGRCSAR